MMQLNRNWVICMALLLHQAVTISLRAGELDISQVLPNSTVAYLAIDQPGTVISTLLDHPLTKHIQGMDAFVKATAADDYRNLLTGISFFEAQIGMPWRPAIETLTAGGIYAGFDASAEGAVLLVHGKDAATMENFRVKILELTRLNGGDAGKPKSYRDLLIYRVGKGGAAVWRDWLIVTNQGDLGKSVLDRLLDSTGKANDTETAGTLSTNADYKTANAARHAKSGLWAFGNIKAIRDAGVEKKIFEGKADNPLAELLLGGIQSTVRHAPYATVSLDLTHSRLTAKFATPCQADWIGEERAYYFGSDFSGVAPQVPEIPETMLALGTYRDIAQMWQRAGDLFNEQVNDKLAEAESSLSTIFAGRDFVEDILGSLNPEIAAIVTRQNFDGVRPVPAIKLPAFALVMKLREPEVMRPELRRTFQSVIGFFNIVGAQNGQPQLEMDMRKEADFDLISTRYLAEPKDKDSENASIHFNFSPSVSFAGDRFVLASTSALATKIAEATNAPPRSDVNTFMTLNAGVIEGVLIDNREQLISQNMLAEGNSHDEATAAIDVLCELVRCFKGAELNLDREHDLLELNIALDVQERYVTPEHGNEPGH